MKDKTRAISSLEDRLNQLVHKWKNSAEDERSQYEARIKRLCVEYKKLSGKSYSWEYNNHKINAIRNGDSFAI